MNKKGANLAASIKQRLLNLAVANGDAVHPEPVWTDFTTLLDFPAPRIRPYPVCSVVAEKFQAMVELGTLNSRMKDYFDVIHLQRHFEFRSEDLQEAMRKTFQRRCRTDCRKDWMSRSGKRPRNRPSGLHSCEKTAFRLKATSEKSAVKSPHSHYP